MEKGPTLPKNIRQIGEISGREKICIEDYVMTWIRKREQQEEKGYLGIFFGERQETEDSVYVFIRGVFEVPAEIQESQDRETAKQEYEKFFGEWTVQGCCVIGVYPTERMKTLTSWLPETGDLIYHLQEQEETLYWTGEEQYGRLRGYFVFYEQNRNMQQYLEELFGQDSVEKESLPDRAIRSFREKVKEKGEQRQSSFLRMASSFAVITILIIGAIVVNRIEDIRSVRELSSVGEDVPVYQPQGEQETLTNAASGDASWQIAERMTAGQKTMEEQETEAKQETTTGRERVAGQEATAGQDVSQEQTGAQYDASEDAARQASEAAQLAGSNAFWEKPDPEDDTNQQADAQTETGNAAETGAKAGTQSTTETGTTDEIQNADETGSQTGAQSTAATGRESEAAQEAVAVRHTQAGYVIKEGDTLAAICSRYYGTMDRIADVCEANDIKDANMILPGQRIVLP